MSNIEKYLNSLQKKLPEICSDRDLVNNLPEIFKNPGTLTRMRARGQTPSYFSIDPNIYYLRDDVINWLRERHKK